MMKIGCHLSVAKGYQHMGEEALSIDANTFQFFTRNPRGSKAKALDLDDAAALMALAQAHSFAPLLAHAPYTLNPCSAEARVRDFAHQVMADDMVIMAALPGNYYTFHPGSHLGQGADAGITMIADLLNVVINPEQTTRILLETMSGKGSEVGSNFEEIRAILDRVQLPEKMGVCLDTCHLYAAGYDLVHDLDGVLEQFDRVIGLKHLCAIHLNDSMTPFNSRKDRHARIGEGSLGLEAIIRIINHPRLKQLPFYLETPNEVSGYAAEIALLRDGYSG